MKKVNYKTFAKTCNKELQVLQDVFQKEHDLNRYDNWFYNQITGLLTFSTANEELNFKYFSVGSFLEKENTWKWSWDNESIDENVKAQATIIREFGQQSNFEKLTTGYFECDEFEAWEFAAIAAKLTNGIGVYRPAIDNQLKLFFVITEIVDNETAKNIKSKYVECGQHSTRRAAFVCKHLFDKKDKVGFVEAFETVEGMELQDDDDFQAWCDECEKVSEEEGEWNDRLETFTDVQLVCEKCYFEMKEFNLGHK